MSILRIRKYTSGIDQKAWILEEDGKIVKVPSPDGQKMMTVGWQIEKDEPFPEAEAVIDHVLRTLTQSTYDGDTQMNIMHQVCMVLNQHGKFDGYLSAGDIDISQRSRKERKRRFKYDFGIP